MMLKLKLQYFGHLMWRVDSLEKTLMLGGIGGRRRRGRKRMRWLDGITVLMYVSLSELWQLVMDREAWRAVIHGVTKNWTRLSNWTELKLSFYLNIFLTQLSSISYHYSQSKPGYNVLIANFFYMTCCIQFANASLFFWVPKSLQMVIAAMKLKDAYFLEGK